VVRLTFKVCKLPKDNHHKILGYERPTDDDRYVTLGTLCGYFHYVQGNPVDGRHEVEVYCDVEDDVVLALNVDDDGGDYCEFAPAWNAGHASAPKRSSMHVAILLLVWENLVNLVVELVIMIRTVVATVVVKFVANAVLEMIEPIVHLH
jgi:hypothetical protein